MGRWSEETTYKGKFNPEKCIKCKYRYSSSNSIGNPVRVGDKWLKVFCNYASITGSTCLKPISLTESIDMRGDDFENCKYFKEGDMVDED